MSHSLRQFNFVTNQRGVTLDLVFSSLASVVVSASDDLLLDEDKHHPALDISFSIPYAALPNNTKLVVDYRRCNLEEVFRQLQILEFPLLLSNSDAVCRFNAFVVQLSELVKSASPLRVVGDRRFPVWFSNKLKSLTVEKKTLHRHYKSTLHPSDYDRFRAARRKCKLLSKECHDRYIRRMEESIPLNLKSFWSHVNNLKGSSVTPTRMCYDTAEALDSSSKCQMFADYFASVFKVADIPAPASDCKSNLSFSNCAFSAVDVQKKLEALDSNKGAGPDGIPPLVLKYCASVISPHLTIYFRSLLSCGVFPDILKCSYVVPIFKSGARDSVRNYRPIVIQSTLAKVFESIVLDFLSFNLRGHIAPEQHGFLRGRSTVTNLLLLQESVMTASVDSRSVDCIYLDFAKAFDRVNHRILVAKLEGFGICGSLLQWISSYLSGRYLTVRYEGATSLPFPVLSGVPQGSHLGPLLFCLFINDIGGSIVTNHLMFADDIKVFCSISSPRDYHSLQLSLNGIMAWCKKNAMDLNIDKCQVITFSHSPVAYSHNYHLDGVILRRVDQVRDLGVILSSNLSPLDHIRYCTAKARSLLGFIQRSTRDFRSPYALITLYKSLVRPILEYGSVIWSPYQTGHIDTLNTIQTRLIRLAGCKLGYPYIQTPIASLESQFSLQPLQRRRDVSDLVFLYKLVNGIIDCPNLLDEVDFKIPLGTRSRTIFRRKYLPVYYAYNSGISRLLRVGGDAASRVDFFSADVTVFKKDINNILD